MIKNKRLNKKGKGFIGDVLKTGYQTVGNLFGGTMKGDEIQLPSISLKHGLYFGSQGPGTSLQTVKRDFKNKGLDTIQKSAVKHDLAYFKAKSGDDIRNADLRFIGTNLKNAAKNLVYDPLESVSNVIGALGIGAKVLGEKIGLVDQYGVQDNKLSKNQKKQIDLMDKKLESEGYGYKHKTSCTIKHRSSKAKAKCKKCNQK